MLFLAPVKESPTIYDAFMEDKRTKGSEDRDDATKAGSQEGAKGIKGAQGGVRKRQGGSGDKKKDPPLTLEEAIAQVSMGLSCTTGLCKFHGPMTKV